MKLLTVMLGVLNALAFVLLFPSASACNGDRLCVDSGAMFVFGDSLLDAGTNNFIPDSNTPVNANSPPVKANFPPYGETFFHFPTGRFTNGRNVIDFIAGHLSFGMVSPPPYLEPEAEFINGVNFASAASGILDSTGKEKNVIPLSLQIQQFLNYSWSLGQKLGGDDKAKDYLSRSLYVIGTGGNDIGLNYLANTTFQKTTSVPDFIKLMISKYNEYLLTLYKNGARNFLVIDVGPLGCSPGVRLAGMKDWKGGCMEIVNELAVAHNAALRQLINQLNQNLVGATILSANTYDLVLNMIQHGQDYGFKNTTSACCGAGPFNTAVSCGLEVPEDKRGEYKAFLCKRPEKFVFWDGIHPTEKVCRMVSRQIWSGNSTFISPINLQTLARRNF